MFIFQYVIIFFVHNNIEKRYEYEKIYRNNVIIYIIFLIIINANAQNINEEENIIEDLLSKYNVITLGQNELNDTDWKEDDYPKGTLSKVIHIVDPI